MSYDNHHVVELDVRPHLRKKLEPFQIIMDTIKSLKDDDIFVLHATFKPTPLLGVLKVRGYVNKVEKKEKDHWIVTFVKKEFKHVLGVDVEELGKDTESGQTDRANDADVANQVDSPHATGQSSAEQREPRTISLNNRGLEPPQPMIRTLSALERSQPGDEVHIHNDRVPVFLIEELKQLGCTYTVDEQPDGSAKVRIRKN